jgi:hypothetical protein
MTAAPAIARSPKSYEISGLALGRECSLRAKGWSGNIGVIKIFFGLGLREIGISFAQGIGIEKGGAA